MFTLPDLPYPTTALEPYIDAQTMDIHHGKHHAAYVKNISDLCPDKSEVDLPALLRDPNPKIKNNAGGHANHSFFWPLMSPNQDQQPAGDLVAALNSAFANLDTFKAKFSSAALAHFGSGWAWLVSSNHQLEIITTPNQDSPLALDKTPLLAIDVWEHAYYLKYQNRRADYIAAWWHVVNWPQVSAHFQEI